MAECPAEAYQMGPEGNLEVRESPDQLFRLGPERRRLVRRDLHRRGQMEIFGVIHGPAVELLRFVALAGVPADLLIPFFAGIRLLYESFA